MAKRQKLIHIHSNVYANGAPQAPATGTLAKGELAINYNDTEPAIFVESNNGTVVKFNAVQRSEIKSITDEQASIQSDIDGLKTNNKIVLNGIQKTLTGSTWSFYAPEASGAANTVLVSSGANQSPKWVNQSSLSVGTASTANKLNSALTIQGNGTSIGSFDGSSATSINITYSNIGAAASQHGHVAADLPTATTSAWGVTKLGTAAGTAAEGNHTHSQYINPTVTDCAQTLSWGTTSTIGKIGDASLTIKAMAKPTPSDIGAAASSHSHGAGDLPTASTSAYGILKLGAGASDAAAGNHTHSQYANPTVTNKNATWSWGNTVTAATIGDTALTITAPTKPTPSDIGAAPSSHQHAGTEVGVATASAVGTVKPGDFLTVNTAGTLSVATGTSNTTVAVGNHNHGTASTSSYGVMKVGDFLSATDGVVKVSTGKTSSTVARGDHSHTYTDVGAAAASHRHEAADLPTASTSAFGITKLGTAAGTAAEGNHTHSQYINPTVTDCAQTLSWGTTSTIGKIGSASLTITAMAKPTPSDIGAAASQHGHVASDLPTASTTAWGVTKLGTAAGTAAEGNHTHSEYINPTVTDCAQTLSWGTTSTIGKIGSSSLTIKAMAKPTPSDIGAAPTSHSHAVAEIPAQTTLSSTNDKVPTGKAVKDYVDGLVASPVNYKGAITNGTLPSSSKVGDMYVVQTSSISIPSGSSATGAAATAEVGDYIIARSVGKWDVIQKNLDGAVTSSVALTSNNFVLGNGNQTIKTSSYGPSSFAAASHQHVAADLPTGSTSAYGILKLGTGSSEAAQGNHTHSEYVNPTVTNCAQTLSWGTTTTVGTIGGTALTIKAMAKPSASDIGAAASTHSHGAADLPTASTSAFGVVKIGTASGTVAAGDHTHSAYVNPTVTNCGQTLSWGSTATVGKIGDVSLTVKAMAKPTPSDIGAAASTHSHGASDLPTASTTAYGILKLGTGSSDAAKGDHTHSAYVNPTVTNCAQTLSWGTIVTAATIGSTAITVKAMAKPTPSDIGAAASTHSHVASDLPTASTTAWGVTKLGTAAGTAAKGNHTHSAYVNPTVTNCAQTLSWNTTITAATIGSTAITVKAMAKPTPADIGAAASSHTHAGTDVGVATSSAVGTVKPGNFLSVDTGGTLSVATGTSSSQVARGDHNHGTASTSSYGVMKVGSFLSASNGVVTVATGTTNATVSRGDHTHTYSQVGAAAASHTHAGTDITSIVSNSDKVDGYHVAVVTSMPASPDANTIYILK